MIYPDALKIALEICGRLKPYCIVVDITGALRREVTHLDYIEICCLPKPYEVKDLFGETTSTVRDPDFINMVKSMGAILKGNPDNGKQLNIQLPSKLQVVIFMPIKADYYRRFAVLTGSLRFAHKVLQGAWESIGWCGTENGLRKQSESYPKANGRDSAGKERIKWICERKEPTLPPEWKSEEEFFEFIGLPWVEPYKRSIN